jgi:hypothetical protein
LTSKQHRLEYYQIAAAQIDQAIDCYKEGTLQGYICATTLAGAGEEILGKLVSNQLNEPNALEDNVISVLAQNGIDKKHKDFEKIKKEFIDVLNAPRNGYKHFKEDFCEKDFDPQLFAEMLINRAIINYGKIRNAITEKMDFFLDLTKKQRSKKQIQN